MDIVCSTDLDKHCTLATTPAENLTLPTSNLANATSEMTKSAGGSGDLGLDLGAVLQEVFNEGPVDDSDGDDCTEVIQDGYPSDDQSDDLRDGVGDDFTACSLDDCGYCGRCMY